MATSPTYEGAVIADAVSYRGQVQPISGTANVASPPNFVPIGNSPAGTTNTLNPPTVLPANSGNLDSFGRQRTSDSNSLLDAKFRYNLLPALMDTTITGTGAVTWVQARSSANLTTTAGGVGVAVIQSHQYFLYRAGQSILINMSITANPAGGAANEATTVKQFGYFDDNNGVFLQIGSAAGDNKWIIRNAASDTNAIAQANWNLDNLLGGGGSTNPSGLTLDLSKSQVMVIDMQFLGVGRVRVGFNIGGQLIYCHQFLNSNVNTNVYMQTGCLPVRARLQTFAAVARSIDLICAGVIKEGTAALEQTYSCTVTGRKTNAVLSMPALTASNPATATSIFALQTRQTNSGTAAATNSAYIRYTGIQFVNTSNNPTYYEVVIIRPAISYAAGNFTGGNGDLCGTNSQYSISTFTGAGTAGAISDGAVAGQFVVDAGYIPASQGSNKSVAQSAQLANLNIISGTDILVVRGYGIGGTATVYLSINFDEYY